MSLMAFADWCQLKHPELLSPYFDFKQTDLLKNEELNQAFLSLSKELSVEFQAYVPSYSHVKISDVSGSYNGDEAKERIKAAIGDFQNIRDKLSSTTEDNVQKNKWY